MPEIKKMNPRARKSMSTSSMMGESTSNSSSDMMRDSWTDFGSARPVQTAPKRKKTFMVGTVIIVILALGALWAGYSMNSKNMSLFGKRAKQFHAVFLSSGQVYFGTIAREDPNNVWLDNVFYIQVSNDTVPGATPSSTPQTVQHQQLVKKGDEPYKPANEIRINRSQVVIIEDLQPGSDIMKQIESRL